MAHHPLAQLWPLRTEANLEIWSNSPNLVCSAIGPNGPHGPSREVEDVLNCARACAATKESK